MNQSYVPFLAALVSLALTAGGCSKRVHKSEKTGASASSAPAGTMARSAAQGKIHSGCPGDCPGDCPMGKKGKPAPIDCPLHAMGGGPGHMGHMHHHGDKHRPFGSVMQYISHLDRKDRDSWQKPEAVITKLALTPNSVVADVGAGSGYFALRIAQRYPKGRVIAIDLETKMLAHIQERAKALKLTNITTVQATASDPKVDSKPDLVLVADVLHHVPNQPAWLAKIFQAMKPGARLAIIEFKEGKLPQGPPAHLKIPRGKLLKLLTSTGFTKPLVDDKLLPYQLLVVLQKPGKK